MARIIGYLMFVVAAFFAWLAWHRASVMSHFAELGIHRPGAGFEFLILVLVGVVIPIGIGALLLRRPDKN